MGRSRPLVVAALLSAAPGCTTYVEPVACESGGPYTCNQSAEVKFCEYVAMAIDGKDCADLGIVASRPFCVVTTERCIDTSYAVRGRDCRVTQYQAVREDEALCSPGTPTFGPP
jgi:hypothetical protein